MKITDEPFLNTSDREHIDFCFVRTCKICHLVYNKNKTTYKPKKTTSLHSNGNVKCRVDPKFQPFSNSDNVLGSVGAQVNIVG